MPGFIPKELICILYLFASFMVIANKTSLNYDRLILFCVHIEA